MESKWGARGVIPLIGEEYFKLLTLKRLQVGSLESAIRCSRDLNLLCMILQRSGKF